MGKDSKEKNKMNDYAKQNLKRRMSWQKIVQEDSQKVKTMKKRSLKDKVWRRATIKIDALVEQRIDGMYY